MKKTLALLVIVLVIVGIVPTTFAQEENVFTFGEFGNAVQLDNAVITDGISFRVLTQGCEGLFFFDGSTTNPIPGLAQSWEASDDGMVWTFHLVEGATFHDGTPFNAEAVKYNFDRWRLTDHPAHFPDQVFEYYDYMWNGFDEGSLIQSVDVVDEYTVQFTLREPYGSMLNTLAMPMFTFSSPTAIEANGTAYGTPDVGYTCTGPFRFVEWISDDHITIERYDDYWGEVPGNVDRIVFRSIPDAGARYAALQSGEIDAMEQPNVEDLDAIEAADDTYILMRGPLNVLYLAFSYRIQEFRDPLVRRAISLAMDRQAIVDAFYPPGAIPAATLIPPTLWGYNPDIPVTAYDPEEARAVLAEAGYPDGFSEVHVLGVDDNNMVTDEVIETIPVRVYFQPVQRPYNPDGEGIGEAMVAMLADIGIEAELASVGDWAAYLDARGIGELFGLYQLGWTGDNGDPDNFAGYFFADTATPKLAEGWYMDPYVAENLQAARVMTDQAEREPIYQDVEMHMYEDTARIYIAHTGVPLAFRSRVSGYVTNPLGTEHFKFVTLN